MARKRIQETADIVQDAIRRVAPSRHDVDAEGLRRYLGLPEHNGFVDDGRVAAALTEMHGLKEWAAKGARELARAVPSLRWSVGEDGAVAWSVRVGLPLLDDGRMELRLMLPPTPQMLEILHGMAVRNDPHHRFDEFKAEIDGLERETGTSMHRMVNRLREDVRADLAEVGSGAASYAAHMDHALRSRQYAFSPELVRALPGKFKEFRAHARKLARQDAGIRNLRERVGFGTYIDKFRAARGMARHIVFHMGPTNSGKTHAALERLAAANKGTYLAPLRLLALENYEVLRDRGLNAGMVTGEEVFGDKGATHVSRTIETADLQHTVDVAVIDEIQMISDPDRGWAWTNALFGIPAKTLILAGSDDALPYVRRAAEAASESLEVVAFERKTPLVLLDEPVPLEEVKAGDAVVAFSRQAVHEQREVLVGLGHTVATIYGALSPEVRRAEAERFRTGEADVLVTTDAIGMGLNLGPLQRVVFSSLRKFDGREDRPLTNPEIRQIAGRAGRFGHHEVGYVAATTEEGIDPIRQALAGAPAAPAADSRFYARPDLVAIRAAASELRTESLHEVLTHFAQAAFYEGSPFQPSDMDAMLQAAEMVDRTRLNLTERVALSMAPIDQRDELSFQVLKGWTQMLASGSGVPALRGNPLAELDYQERTVRLAGAYLWLSRRFPDAFDDADRMRHVRAQANEAIQRHLQETATKRVAKRVTAGHRG
ncbi:helicase-related protein [Microvirga sesbaniae]|uniref:helicase-related protein n=1 Tax=Microvirga sesbaniae TaxID=681392 RepID=UPI0021C6B952|nr:helicase-related protein [Microvirga sp. HBU67692]